MMGITDDHHANSFYHFVFLVNSCAIINIIIIVVMISGKGDKRNKNNFIYTNNKGSRNIAMFMKNITVVVKVILGNRVK